MVLAVEFGERAATAFSEFMEWLPRFAGFLAILLVGWIVARLVKALVTAALRRVGFDRTLHSGTGGSVLRRVTESPSGLTGTLAFWAIMFGAVSLAVSVLGIDALEDLVAAIYGYLPNVLAAVLIFLVAGALAAGVATLVSRTMGETTLGRIAATVAPIVIMAVASFMILDQLQIAEDIVVITYAALLGAVALGAAIAFGLGGRDVASRMLEGAYEKGQERKDQFRAEAGQGVARAQERVNQAKAQATNADGSTAGARAT